MKNRNLSTPAVTLSTVGALALANAAGLEGAAAASEVHAVAPVSHPDTYMADADAAWDAAILEEGLRNPDPLGPYVPVVCVRPRVNVGAKVALRDLFDVPGSKYTLKELVAQTGKTEVNVRTQLSDMRSAKYAGKHGVYMTQATRVAGVTYYSKS